jgi:hypothetical protein
MTVSYLQSRRLLVRGARGATGSPTDPFVLTVEEYAEATLEPGETYSVEPAEVSVEADLPELTDDRWDGVRLKVTDYGGAGNWRFAECWGDGAGGRAWVML